MKPESHGLEAVALDGKFAKERSLSRASTRNGGNLKDCE
jgi:hypothetical protein